MGDPSLGGEGLNIFDSKDVKLINIPFFLTSPPTIIYGMKKKSYEVGQCPPATGTVLLHKRQDGGTSAMPAVQLVLQCFTDTTH